MPAGGKFGIRALCRFNRGKVSVVTPVELAIEQTKQFLFRPFDLNRWFIIGFCAWLANLGQGGGNGFNFNYGKHYNTGHVRDAFNHARAYVMDNLGWIVPLAILVVLLGMALWVLVLWASSRGKFVFLHCVALNQADIGGPWQQYAREADSLFRFRLVLGILVALLTLPLIAITAIAIWRMIDNGAVTAHELVVAIVSGLSFGALCVFGAVIAKLTTDFVVPIMFLRRNRCLQAWRELRSLMAVNVGNFILYILFQIVIALATGVLVLVAVLITCCIAGCLMMIPYIGAVVLLPVSAFKRSYSLHYLAQYGPDFTVFPPAPPSPPAAAQAIPPLAA